MSRTDARYFDRPDRIIVTVLYPLWSHCNSTNQRFSQRMSNLHSTIQKAELTCCNIPLELLLRICVEKSAAQRLLQDGCIELCRHQRKFKSAVKVLHWIVGYRIILMLLFDSKKVLSSLTSRNLSCFLNWKLKRMTSRQSKKWSCVFRASLC